MPATNKLIVTKDGDSVEILETAAMTGGERVRARFRFKAGSPLGLGHIHPLQDETMEVLSGRLGYWLNNTKKILSPGESVTLPRGIVHRHGPEGSEDVVVLTTVTPGLDSDYLFENFFGISSECGFTSARTLFHIIIWNAKLKSGFALPVIPIWLQSTLTRALTPILYLFGYRAVYKRFSGEEW
jgi:quercetin dioxygenase-like cupin family protein